ncbi:Glycosyltransferase involved in cell wall bisynthesis [Parafilimonas terrae]|uniref:Glycosyltransferase involved in cell wall bisynthesis n=2 Tax=Parafilimonas terrae TaxID=1465490 RepID=A0A1I5SDP3_9BACT|nr:Glycosyltransferase involved in cell wall bisynthesis [Parafilimonas terrae]
MGGQKGIAIFCKYLGEQNDLTVVSVEDNDINLAETYNMVPLFSKERRRYINPFYVSQIKKIIKQKDIKNVITEHPYMAWMGWVLKRSLGIKWFVHTHNIEYERFRTIGKWWHSLLKIYESAVYNHADKVFFKTKEDIEFAIAKKMVKEKNAVLVPFGIDIDKMPADKPEVKRAIYKKHNIPTDATLLFFNGTLDYKPNLHALLFILNELNPALLKTPSFNYRFLICGRGLPASFNELKDYKNRNIVYAGFVDDVYAYFKAADIFVNPVITGGGVKTKIVEAMGYGVSVVSCVSGAAGIELSVCGEKIKVVNDNDVSTFVTAIINNESMQANTPQQYYDYYSWRNIVKKLQSLFNA